MVMKKCKICGKEFDAKGRQVCCSDECKKENIKIKNRKASKKYYRKNPEYYQDWYSENKEDRKEYYKNWYSENKEDRREYYKNWYSENKEDKIKYWEKYFNRNNGLVGGDERKDKHGNIISVLGSSYDDYSYNAEKEMEKAKKANDKMIDDFLNELNL